MQPGSFLVAGPSWPGAFCISAAPTECMSMPCKPRTRRSSSSTCALPRSELQIVVDHGNAMRESPPRSSVCGSTDSIANWLSKTAFSLHSRSFFAQCERVAQSPVWRGRVLDSVEERGPISLTLKHVGFVGLDDFPRSPVGSAHDEETHFDTTQCGGKNYAILYRGLGTCFKPSASGLADSHCDVLGCQTEPHRSLMLLRAFPNVSRARQCAANRRT